MEEKEKNKFLEQVKEKSLDKEIFTSMKFEDNMDYRFDLVEEDALERGKQQTIKNTIKNMLDNNLDLEIISKVTGSSLEEIEEIAESRED